MGDYQSARTAAVDTLDRFYNDLYNKELKLKLGDVELADLYSAVNDFVRRIANDVGRKDPRLKIDDVISVGSAREGTQICTPCEYDFLLVLKELSNNNDLILYAGCPDSLSYVHVYLHGARSRRCFNDIAKDGYLKATQNYENYIPFYLQHGLRQILKTSLQSVATDNASLEVSNDSGTLKFKSTEIEAHGPALMLLLSWQSHHGSDPMDISIDLCPAIRTLPLRLFAGKVEELITPESVACQSYYEHARKTVSVLLIPCRRSATCVYGLCFKVAHTETEMRLMENITEHHRRCYKILKYLINGRPGPSIAKKSVLSKVYYPFYDYPTQVHSYALKVLVWNHHYKSKCIENNCLSSCLDEILSDLKTILTYDTSGMNYDVIVENMLPCPFNNRDSVWSKTKRFEERRQLEVAIENRVVLRRRVLSLMEALTKLSMMDIDKYDFEAVKIETLNIASYDEKRSHVLMSAAYVCFAVLVALLL